MNMDLYIGAATALMFLAGIALILITARDRSVMRKRWDRNPRG